jgi:hypothetical protein
MGYVYVMGPCFSCRRIFSYNPKHVPSIPSHLSGTGTREPVCLECINQANPHRIKNGLPPIVPHPEAYDPLPEEEL